MSNTETDNDALQEIHGNGASADVDMTNLFAVGQLDFGVEADMGTCRPGYTHNL